MIKRKRDGRLVEVNIDPRIKPKANPQTPDEAIRQVSIQQLALLLYHYYIIVDHPLFGPDMDADKSPREFLASLNNKIDIKKDELEKLMYNMQLAYEIGMYFSPDDVSIKDRFKNILAGSDEEFDPLYCLIRSK